ncbi:MAG TPA: hypothetical protein DIT13_04630 [Verrucomicrobiales bacterium]|nr:hypothetical protein [Verrucomicrobiales bacterium]HRJ08724.1 hypothetical protein [Prosthecobacter sp.]HRK15202.1 hypothetical protein [Prosthecobacter sp.]
MKTLVTKSTTLLCAAALCAAAALSTPRTASAFGNVVESTRPRVILASPNASAPRTVITLLGDGLRRDKDGNLWTGRAPYQIQFPTAAPGQFVNAAFTFVSTNSLRVTVPASAVSGRIRLVQQEYVTSTLFSFTVNNPLPAQQSRLNMQNNSQYNAISLRVNGVEQFAQGNGIPPGRLQEGIHTPGRKTVVVEIGINPGEPLFNFTFNAFLTAGRTTTLTIPRVTLAQLMTNFLASRDYKSDVLADNNGNLYQRTVRFNANGSYQIIDSTGSKPVTVETGRYTETAWADNSIQVSFRLGTRAVDIFHPFAQFISNVGRNNQRIVVTAQ